MLEELVQEIDHKYPNRTFLSIDDVAEFLSCDRKVILNWAKRADQNRRPPRFIVGNEPRFPKKQFIQWLIKEQATKGFERQI